MKNPGVEWFPVGQHTVDVARDPEVRTQTWFRVPKADSGCESGLKPAGRKVANRMRLRTQQKGPLCEARL